MASRPPGAQEHRTTARISAFRLAVRSFDAETAFSDTTGKIRPRLISLRPTEKRGGEADTLELVLDDADGKLAIPDRGAIITVSLGWSCGSGCHRRPGRQGSFQGRRDELDQRAGASDAAGALGPT